MYVDLVGKLKSMEFMTSKQEQSNALLRHFTRILHGHGTVQFRLMKMVF